MDRIQLRRDTSARWAEINPILLEGEVGYEIDTKLRKIGDGVNRWNDLEYLKAEGISQETGNSQNITMSQDAITRELSTLGSNLLNNNFIGKGAAFSPCYINGLIPEHTYELTLANLWVTDSIEVTDPNVYKFVVSYFVGGKENRLVKVGIRGELSSLYQFTIPKEFDYIMIGGRAESGTVIRFNLVDVTERIRLKNQIETELDRTNEENALQEYALRRNLGEGYMNNGMTENSYYIYSYGKEEVVQYGSEIYNISPFIPIKRGDKIEWSGGFSGPIESAPVLALFDDKMQLVDYLGSTNDPRIYESLGEDYSYCKFSFRKDYIGAYIKVNDIKVYEWNGVPYIKEVEDSEDSEALSMPKLFIGDLINSGSKAGYIESIESENNKRIITKSTCCLPYEGATIKIKLPIGVSCYFWIGTSNGRVSSTNGTWLVNGDTFTFPENIKAYRCVFRADDSSDILASDFKNMVNSGQIAFYLSKDEPNILDRNIDKDVRVGSLKRKLLGRRFERNGMDSLPVFAHISDIHGDATRLNNCMDYCDHIGVDALLATGDFSMYQYKDYCSFQEDIAENHSTPYCFCIGNHEAYPSGESNLYEDCIRNLAINQGYFSVEESITDKCYWYKDFTNKKIRVIAINYYEDGVYNGYLGQAQLLWFVSTLKSTPIGFGVLVILHSPEDKVIVDEPYDVFRQKKRMLDYQENGFYVGNRPISKIIDAFISRGSVNIEYTENSNSERVVINDDFSGIDSSIEFVAYAVGHRHEDWIGYYANSVNKQLSLGITAGVALYGDSSNAAWANQEDLPRGGKGVCQDAFNIYAIDREQGVVKVVRIGADVTESFEDRKIMIIPYR